jgi:nucleotide-binding universal stress UspA family protein
MIKDIILNLERDESLDQLRDYALSVAERFEAHITGVVFGGPNIPAFAQLDFPSQISAEMMAEGELAARAAVARFDTAAKRSLVSNDHHLVLDSEGKARVFSKLARRFDLSVVMQSNPDGVNNDALIEAALFDSGRPVVVVPYIQRDVLKLDRIICCWDGSRTAARAINDALPLLTKAQDVELLIVLSERTSKAQDEMGGLEMAKHLARHKVKIDFRTTFAVDTDVSSAILSHAALCSASMIVMGGYGHSRMREFILGGATRGMLSSMTIPVFMSH